MWSKLLQLLDRAAVTYFAYRSGKSSVIKEMQSKLLKEIADVKKAHSDIDDLDTDKLLDTLYE